MKRKKHIFTKIVAGLLAAAIIVGTGAPCGGWERPESPAVNLLTGTPSQNGTENFQIQPGTELITVDEQSARLLEDKFTVYTYTDGSISSRFLRLKDCSDQTLVKSGVTNAQSGTTVKTNTFGTIDWTHANDGWFTLTCSEDTAHNVKGAVDYTEAGGEICYFDWYMERGKAYRIPAYKGNGKYTLSLLRHAYDNAYIPKMMISVNVKRNNDFDAYLQSTKDADFADAPKAVAKAKQLTKNCKSDREKINVIYNWVYENIIYADEMTSARTGRTQAETVYDLDKILAEKRGVCGHRSALMAGMLRSLNIPCKIAFDLEHAWISVWNETGTYTKNGITYSTGAWVDLDSTSKGLKKNADAVRFM